MGKAWPDDLESAHTPRRKRPPKYGVDTEMTALLAIAERALPHEDAIVAVKQRPRYTTADDGDVSAFIYNVRRALYSKDKPLADELTHRFIIKHPPVVEPAPPRQPFWRRLWDSELMGWIFAAFQLTALLTAVEAWK